MTGQFGFCNPSGNRAKIAARNASAQSRRLIHAEALEDAVSFQVYVSMGIDWLHRRQHQLRSIQRPNVRSSLA
jgi:hypothetical protein